MEAERFDALSRSLSQCSPRRRVLAGLASGLGTVLPLAIGTIAAAGKKKRKRKPPPPLAFATVVVTGTSAPTATVFQWNWDGSVAHPASGFAFDTGGSMGIAADATADQVRARLAANVRAFASDELAGQGHDVPAERIAVVVL